MAPMLLSFDNLHNFIVTFRRKLNLSEHRSFHVASAYTLTKNCAFDNMSANLISLSLNIYIFIYLYIYIEREREREERVKLNSLTVNRILIFP